MRLLGLAIAALATWGVGEGQAASCLEVTLTGTQGGPPVFMGQAGSGTLVTYGEEETGCRDVLTDKSGLACGGRAAICVHARRAGCAFFACFPGAAGD